ncbi:NFATC2-interacting protein [Tachyglossus aculeatus]|uniref:NFATC2-interacting protein n=1 Tax=Tachyglossus aculeatus TaxID=9261 RepID=UPI0018F4E29E|nr:NFATC2-interacting protein [Tachyglossus aculeatus]
MAERGHRGHSPASVVVLTSDSDDDVREGPPLGRPEVLVLEEDGQPLTPNLTLNLTPKLTPAGPDSDSEAEGKEAHWPPRRPKRRRLLLGRREAPSIPVYSGKVNSSLRLFIEDPKPPQSPEPPDPDPRSPHRETPLTPDSDSQEKQLQRDDDSEKEVFVVRDASPSPPPQPRRRKQARAQQKIREVDRRLQDLRSCLSPSPRHGRRPPPDLDEDVILVEGSLSREPAPTSRPILLKVRCRADLFRVPVLMSDPLQGVVDHLASQLGVSSARILLLLREAELPSSATPETLRLSVADIIDCVVLPKSPEPAEESDVDGKLRLRVQGKEKHQLLEVTVSRAAPLGTLMSHYAEAMGLTGRELSFFFDGEKLTRQRTPAELGMEQGDLIEVWG